MPFPHALSLTTVFALTVINKESTRVVVRDELPVPQNYQNSNFWLSFE